MREPLPQHRFAYGRDGYRSCRKRLDDRVASNETTDPIQWVATDCEYGADWPSVENRALRHICEAGRISTGIGDITHSRGDRNFPGRPKPDIAFGRANIAIVWLCLTLFSGRRSFANPAVDYRLSHD